MDDVARSDGGCWIGGLDEIIEIVVGVRVPFGAHIVHPVAVGFIALAGMAAEIGVLVLSFIDTEIAKRRSATSGLLSFEEIRDAVSSATSKRVRPVAMTAISTMAGLIPIMLSSGTGSDVTHRIAAPMLGGMLTVTILNLLVLPVIYSLILEFQEKRRFNDGSSTTLAEIEETLEAE